MRFLRPFHSHLHPAPEVSVDYCIKKGILQVEFQIKGHKNYFDSDQFSLIGWENWGLWNYDVVELFLTKSPLGPYLEVQASAVGQKFALKVIKPRVETQKITGLDCEVESSVDSDGFRVNFTLNCDEIPGEGSELYGNFHACLGEAAKRNYYYLFLYSQARPDVHRPDLFKKLGDIQ